MDLIFPGDPGYDGLEAGELRRFWMANPLNDGAWKRCDYLFVGRIEMFYTGGPAYASTFERRIGPMTTEEAAERTVALQAAFYIGEFYSRKSLWPPFRWALLAILRRMAFSPYERKLRRRKIVRRLLQWPKRDAQ